LCAGVERAQRGRSGTVPRVRQRVGDGHAVRYPATVARDNLSEVFTKVLLSLRLVAAV
jgi:hypothetical protein